MRFDMYGFEFSIVKFPKLYTERVFQMRLCAGYPPRPEIARKMPFPDYNCNDARGLVHSSQWKFTQRSFLPNNSFLLCRRTNCERKAFSHKIRQITVLGTPRFWAVQVPRVEPVNGAQLSRL